MITIAIGIIGTITIGTMGTITIEMTGAIETNEFFIYSGSEIRGRGQVLQSYMDQRLSSKSLGRQGQVASWERSGPVESLADRFRA